MQRFHLILLLPFTFIATSCSIVAARDDRSNTLQTETRHLLTKEEPSVANGNGYKSSNSRYSAIEERGVLSSVVSKIKGVFGRNKIVDLGNKLDCVRKDSDGALALGNSRVMKKLTAAVENDPKFFSKLKNNPESVEKLVKNPELQRAAATMEKSNIKISKNDINQLRTIVAENPSKASMLDDGLLVLRVILKVAPLVLFTGIIFYLMGWGVYNGLKS
ncbi:hypothetical protein PHYSODRAFT_490207 [Phytophthora sojae]|uniref:RxLR effector protein n=1 Tax=Phytophthora sojae (strain P6497) TaxID=1094619 RepID=G4Z566_PHYSP|nr:hypothetical protein PHYSODRAFT_490207 [Phytophthora sojae]EGZ20209.1 hypothetical protein PHYSODRAFT_490207 [Phytophthora sojae]|eukprot:XP_009522926.1 hypothetical protein PHYSODRAFT_490207 [Phytophthora sojae]